MINVGHCTQLDLLLEDVNALALEPGNWWHARVKLVEKWLWEEANRAEIPDDGSEEVRSPWWFKSGLLLRK